MFIYILNIIWIVFISFLPIIIWAYIFSYIDDRELNRKRFITWIIAGWLSVFPILYIDKIVSFINFEYLNTFMFIYNINNIFSWFKLWLSLEIFLILIVFFSFILGLLLNRNYKIIKTYFKNILVFTIITFLVSLFVYWFNYSNFSFLNTNIDEPIIYKDMIFNSIKLILFYYLIVAFIEESSKHFNFLQSSMLHIDSVKTGVLYAIFIALWFSFVENILYFSSFYKEYWLWSELFKLYLFRSVFSVIVHVLASSLVAYYFSKAYLLYKNKDLSFPYIKIFFIWLFLWIFLHLIFDITITLWFSFIIFIYLIWGYLYISSIFYKDL